ncbi:MAG: hypothetical protein M1153_01960 [Patescibacteria group bacterium]|nr:hypothetical protein [Patescibacteria group bacterium]
MIKKAIWILIVLIFVATGIWFWANHYFALPSATRPAPTENQATSTTGFGAQIYAKESNPINNVSTATSPTVPNPVQGLYKNPFQ